MKITKSQLVKIIQEEISNVTEGAPAGDEFGDVKMDKYWIDKDENSHGLPRMGDPETSSQELIIALGVLAKELGTSKEKVFNHLMSLTKMDENMGDFYDPRQPGGYHDQPKTSNMQLARQCKEGDQAACKMLKKRLGKE